MTPILLQAIPLTNVGRCQSAPGKSKDTALTILTAGPVAELLEKLHQEAQAADGAFMASMMAKPRLRPAAVIVGENAFAPDYLAYVRDSTNGYMSQSLPIDKGRGNEFTGRTR